MKRNPAVLKLVTRQPEVIHRRHRRPLVERIAKAGNSLATLEDAADWAELSEMLFGEGDRRLVPEETPERGGNVIPIRQRSTSAEISAVRIQEERRGRR